MTQPRDPDFLGWAPDDLGFWDAPAPAATPAPVIPPPAHPQAAEVAAPRRAAPTGNAPPPGRRAASFPPPTTPPLPFQAIAPTPPGARPARRRVSPVFGPIVGVFVFALVFTLAVLASVLSGGGSPFVVIVAGTVTVLLGRLAWALRPR